MIRWCEHCQSQEALINVVEQVTDKEKYTHHWCIECAKIKVLTT